MQTLPIALVEQYSCDHIKALRGGAAPRKQPGRIKRALRRRH